jgi:hypothetical protein
MCPILKELSNNLQPYPEVVRVINKILAKKGDNIRILEHLLSYAEHQVGKQASGIGYRERKDGQRINNWNAEIAILSDIKSQIANIYAMDNSLSNSIRNDKMIPYLQRSLSLLTSHSLCSSSRTLT